MLVRVPREPAVGEKPKFAELATGLSCRTPWAWAGLCVAIPILTADREGTREFVTGKRLNTIGGVTWAADLQNNLSMVATPASDPFMSWVDHPRNETASDEITVYARVRRQGNPDAAGGIFCKKRGDTTPFTTFVLRGNDSSTAGEVLFGLAIDGVSYSTPPGTTALPESKYVNLFGRWRSGGTLTLDYLADGGTVEIPQQDEGVNRSGTLSYGAAKLWLGAADDETVNYGAHISQAMAWARRLSDVEITALAADPFGWISPRRETVGVSSPFPVLLGTTWRVFGYSMFPTTGERDAMQARVQAWVVAHTVSQVWASTQNIILDDGSTYMLTAGQATPSLNDADGGGPWPGLTWSYETASQGLRDNFGEVVGSAEADAALVGSQWGEVTPP